MQEKRDAGEALRKGFLGHCPRCGRGKMFQGYLTVVEECAACGEPLGEYRAADGPAFFTISIVGVLLVPLFGLTFAAFRPEPLTLLLIVGVIATLLTLMLLRPVKGAVVGYLWAKHERDPGA